jgi:hypothetical protein
MILIAIAMRHDKHILVELVRSLFIRWYILFMVIIGFGYFFIADVTIAQTEQNRSINNEVLVDQIPPDNRGGKAYKLVYLVEVPIEVYWKFKTHFNNNFLVTNKYIREHHFISRSGNRFTTKDKYTYGPDVYYHWQTTVFPDSYRLDFVLLNPEACGQKFHYGYIQLEPLKQKTRVTQVAYFDFWGVSIWVNYPWRGGMMDFLSYTANWEKETILHLRSRYEDVSD